MRVVVPIPVAVVLFAAMMWWYQPVPPTTVIIVPAEAATAIPVPTGVTASQAPVTPSARADWARELLRRWPISNSNPDNATINLVVAWTIAEDSCMSDCGYSSAWERNNPLNTTQLGFNETKTINGDGVKGYASYEDGLQATSQTLSYGYYTEIVAGLATNDPERALRGMYASPWGTSIGNVERIWRSQ